MITNQNTNFVYFSEKILDGEYAPAYQRIKIILDKHNINTGLLKGTADIWCRDYMPIQVSKDRFVQFRYEPSYLKKDLDLQSDTERVCEMNGIQPKVSKINLDGGNVVQWDDKVIVSDRIFSENPEYKDKADLNRELRALLDATVIVIPSISPSEDMTGHADGMVRFFNHDTLIGNNRNMEYDYWQNGIERVLKEHNLKYIDVPFMDKYRDKKHPDTAIGCYVNFLEIGDLIILPIFEVKNNHDAEVIGLFKKHYPDRIIEPVNINEIANDGGLLNCITWAIQK